jgi:hypothetical protein
MAAIQERAGSYRVLFRHIGKQHAFTLGKVTRREADAKAAQAGFLLLRLRQKLILLPPGVDIVEFLESADPLRYRGIALGQGRRTGPAPGKGPI